MKLSTLILLFTSLSFAHENGVKEMLEKTKSANPNDFQVGDIVESDGAEEGTLAQVQALFKVDKTKRNQRLSKEKGEALKQAVANGNKGKDKAVASAGFVGGDTARYYREAFPGENVEKNPTFKKEGNKNGVVDNYKIENAGGTKSRCNRFTPDGEGNFRLNAISGPKLCQKFTAASPDELYRGAATPKIPDVGNGGMLNGAGNFTSLKGADAFFCSGLKASDVMTQTTWTEYTFLDRASYEAAAQGNLGNADTAILLVTRDQDKPGCWNLQAGGGGGQSQGDAAAMAQRDPAARGGGAAGAI